LSISAGFVALRVFFSFVKDKKEYTASGEREASEKKTKDDRLRTMLKI